MDEEGVYIESSLENPACTSKRATIPFEFADSGPKSPNQQTASSPDRIPGSPKGSRTICNTSSDWITSLICDKPDAIIDVTSLFIGWQVVLCSWEPLDVATTYYIFTVFLKEKMRQPYSNFSYMEVYHQIYGRKFSFTVTRWGGISSDIRGSVKITETWLISFYWVSSFC